MPILDVKKSLDATLRVDCSASSVGFSVRYDSGYEYPFSGIYLNWLEWDRLVAWIELQRKEAALREAD